MENWKTIKDYETYEVSDFGRIRNKITKNMLNPSVKKSGYSTVVLYGPKKHQVFFVHRLVAKAFIQNEKVQVDHIDGNRQNNVLNNLRWATPVENGGNKKIQKNKVHSRYKGVTKERNKYRAVITFNRKTIFLGHYETELQASQAYDLKALELLGQFAKTNHPITTYL